MRLGVVDERLGAVAALQQERLAARDLAEPLLEPVDLGGTVIGGTLSSSARTRAT